MTTHSLYNHCDSPLNLEYIVLIEQPIHFAISDLVIPFLFISASRLLHFTTINFLTSFVPLRYSAISIYTILRYFAFVKNYFYAFLRNFAISYLHIAYFVVISGYGGEKNATFDYIKKTNGR